jgi:hypothetical protein
MVAEEEEEAVEDLTEENQALVEAYSQALRARQKQACYEKSVVDETSTSSLFRGNYAYKSDFAHSATGTCDTLALTSIPTIRSSDWIVDSGASRHMTGAAGEFCSYSRLAVSESIQTTDGTAQPVVGKGTVKCTNTLTLFNVLHALFPMNLLSISAIVSQLKCVVLFDIPKVIFQKKRTDRLLSTDTWHNGLWYMDKEGTDSTLSSIVGKTGGIKRCR